MCLIFSKSKGDSFVDDVEFPGQADMEMPEQTLHEEHTHSSTKPNYSNMNGFPGTVNPKRDFSTAYSDSTQKYKMVSHGGIVKCLIPSPYFFLRPKHYKFHTCSICGAVTTEELLKISEMAKNRTKKESENINNRKKTSTKDYSKQHLSERSQERRVPASRIGRMASFGGMLLFFVAL